MLVRQRLPDRQPPRQRPEERRDDIEEKREDDPAPDDQAERLEHAPPIRPAPPDRYERENERDERDDDLRPTGPPHATNGAHAARASSRPIPVTLAYTSSRRRAIVGHE